MNNCKSLTGLAVFALAAGAVVLSGCSSEPKTAEKKEALTISGSAALATFKAKDSTLQQLLDKAVGYVIYPEVGKAGFIVGGSYGNGEVYENGKLIGYSGITAGSFGLQIGAQSFSELVIFMTKDALTNFKNGSFSLSGDVSAVAMTAGAAAKTDPAKAVIVFLDAKGGLMAEASVAGQVLSFKAK